MMLDQNKIDWEKPLALILSCVDIAIVVVFFQMSSSLRRYEALGSSLIAVGLCLVGILFPDEKTGDNDDYTVIIPSRFGAWLFLSVFPIGCFIFILVCGK
jgi:hypothetical protein